MQYSKEMLENRTYTNTPTQMEPLNPQTILPAGIADPREARKLAKQVKTGALVQENGDIIFRMIAPEAKTVSVDLPTANIHVDLEKKEDGIWEATLPYTVCGPKATEWKVDGNYVLHPWGNIYFSYSHPVNYVDIPDPSLPEVLIKDVPHGSVRHEYYYSEATGQYEQAVVYTPAGYDNSTEEYPVLYLQHGAGEGATSWVWDGKANFILDNLIAEGKAKPFIVVMNNGMTRTKKDEDPANGRFAGFTDMLLLDCMPFIEKKFRVRKDKWGRAMAGLSMGSMQTSLIGMTHPELFGYLGLFSGFMRGAGMGASTEIADNPHLAIIQDAGKFMEEFKVFFRGVGQDDPLKKAFIEDDGICEKYAIDPANNPNHTRIIYPGVHDWNVWRMCLRDFAQLIFK